MKALRVAHEDVSPPITNSSEVSTAYDDQANIGFHNMAVGFLARSWTTHLDRTKQYQAFTRQLSR